MAGRPKDDALPRGAERLLRLALEGEVAEAVLGDLEEGWRRRKERPGARRWLARQVVGSVWAGARERWTPERWTDGEATGAYRVIQTGGDGMMGTLWRDTRVALRSFRRRPGFTVAAVATLALGIGAVTGIFSLVHGVLLRPLPYDAPERIVRLQELRPGPEPLPISVSYPNYRDWTEAAGSFSAMTMVSYGSTVLTGDGEALRLATNFVTPDYFRIFGGEVARGRLFDEGGTYPPHAAPEAVVSHELWESRWGGDPELLGRTIQTGGTSVQVVGILAPGFTDPNAGTPFTAGDNEVGLFLPLGLAPIGGLPETIFERRQARFLTAFARLADGVSQEAAARELDAIQTRLGEIHPDANRGYLGAVTELQASLTEGIRGPVVVLMVGALVLLAIACFNVANLLLVRGAGRTQEVALRRALGADRRSLLRQFTVESVLLTMAGGVLGTLLASFALEPLLALSPTQLPTVTSVRLDGPVLAAALGLCLLTGLAFGLLPILRGSDSGVRDALGGSRRSVGSQGSRRLQNGIVTAEIAVAMGLLVAATLVVSSFESLRATGPGYDTEALLTARLDLPLSRYASAEARMGFVREAAARIEARPEVRWVDYWAPGRPGQTFVFQTIVRDGDAVERQAEAEVGRFHLLEPGTLKRLGVEVVRGRALTEADQEGNPAVALVTRATAERLWPGQDAVGQRYRRFQPAGADRPDNPWVEVVGVVEDAALAGRVTVAGALETDIDIVYPLAFRPPSSLTLVVRGERSTDGLATAVRDALRTVDPELALYNVATMEENLAGEEGPLRFAAVLLALFGGLAVLLAALGVYGVLSYSVGQRTREIGVRVALGAERGATVLRFVQAGGALAAAGVLMGALTSVALARLLDRYLVGLAQLDATAVALPGLVLLVVALVACWIPARRAARVDPVVALRAE